MGMIQEDEFIRIKQLQATGLSKSLIAKVTSRCYNTIDKLFNAEDYAEFAPSKVKKVVEQAPTDNPVAVDYTNIVDRLNNIEVALNSLLVAVEHKESVANASFWRR